MRTVQGYSLKELLQNPDSVPSDVRKKLASQLLKEMLVQIFELGLFHADPHAGNLILLPDHTIGLFDWGLTGHMDAEARKHISSILKAVVRRDLDKLAKALLDMGHSLKRRDLTQDRIKLELKKLAQILEAAKQEKGKSKVTLPLLLNESLAACDRLTLPVPQNLLLMAKALLTIEGLAKGLDPEASIGKAAFPYLFKAMNPGLGDLLAMGKNLVFFAKNLDKSSP